MSESVKADLMMGFVGPKGIVWAESTLEVAEGDSFLKDYIVAPSADYFSSFFEVKSFNFAMAVKGADQAAGALSKQQAQQAQQASGGTKPPKDAFERWRSATDEEAKTMHFPVEFNTFTFSRLLDGASPTFFQACCNSTTFTSAALVKRVSVGATPSDPLGKARGFLRFDFREVLMTGIEWADGELVTENCTFICRAMRVRYKQQKFDGGFETDVPRAVWPDPRGLGGSIDDPKLEAILAELAING